jgi:peptidoglycan hydrolase CwlO-like protein
MSETFYVQVIASIAIVLAAVLPTLILVTKKQNQVHADNRADHQSTSKMVTEMHHDMGFIKQDISFMKGDVNTLKVDVNSIKTDLGNHNTRLHDLELDLSKAEGSVTIPITPNTGD